jgi:hypothetical protein
MPGKTKKRCFVLMPFKENLKEVYWNAIRPACIKAGFESLRVDELKGSFNINRRIIEEIFLSDAIVADLTGWNPNVFYEMGVAHTIDNKTVMIIQKRGKLPFDVSSYHCILYEQTPIGLETLKQRIFEALSSIAEWRKYPTNPVQEFKPHEALVPKIWLEELKFELGKKDELLLQSVPKTEYEALQKKLATIGSQRINKKSAKLISKISLRPYPLENLSHEKVKNMLVEKNFFDNDWNENGEGLPHQYECNEWLIADKTTGLTWQQSGSEDYVNYAKAENYIAGLQLDNFAGYKDWRIPTLEEAMSLMEREKIGELYINPLFDRKQSWIWTSDKESLDVAWVVNFSYGICLSRPVNDSRYVRAVR